MIKDYAEVAGLQDLPCCVRPIRADAQRQYAQRQINVTHRVYFDQVYPLVKQDRLTVDNGKILLITGIFDTDELEELFVVDCEEQMD